MSLLNEFAKTLVARSKFPKLNAVVLAQWLLETGRFTSKLSIEHFNPAGMKYRPELAGLATPVEVTVTSEESGKATFCHFATVQAGVDGYWKFLTRSPYAGWEAHVDDPYEFINFIAKCGWSADHNYEAKVKMLVPEAEEALKALAPVAETTYWAEIYPLTGNVYLIQEPSGKAIKAWETRRETAKLAAALDETRVVAGKLVFAPANKGEPAVMPQEPTKPQPIGRTIFLDPGHSELRPGARSNNGAVEEEDLNRLQVKILTERLEAKGFAVKSWDPADDNLQAIGNAARGCDMFVSCHHNSYDNGKADPYACCMTHASLRNANDNKFASLVAQKVAAALGHRLFQADGELPGVYPAGLGVLRGASEVGVPVKVLVESYFLNPYTDASAAAARSVKAAHAIADAIIEWYA